MPVRSKRTRPSARPLPVEELNSSSRDVRPAIRKDGLEMFLDSDRSGTNGGRRPLRFDTREHHGALVNAGQSGGSRQ